MHALRTPRPAAVAALVCLAGLTSPLRGEPDKAAWDTRRTTSPETVTELKALQSRVKDVVAKVTPSTVGLLVRPGAGSGVIVSEDGLVLTAAHVIGRPGRDIEFVLSDGTIVKGKTLGLNTKADSGMARITDKPPKTAKWPGAADGKWPAAALGSAVETDARDELKTKGQWVVSLGHPGGPKENRPPPVRVGRLGSYSKSDLALMSDCTLVGGDSGGPLFDLDGKVVGIHSRIGPFLEFNIHVPTEAFKGDWDKLAKGERVGRQNAVELGVVLEEDEDAPTVKSVVAGGLAEKAGVKPGDVIKKVDGESVDSAEDVTQAVSGLNAGKREFDLEVRRGDETLTLKVTVRGQRPKKDRKPDNDE